MNAQAVTDPKRPHRYAKWLRRLKGKHGVYAIYHPCESCGYTLAADCKRSGCPGYGPVCQYVGVSSRARLYGTITRHFQVWSDRKDGTSPGFTFDRRVATVDHQTFEDPRVALVAEQAWIADRAPVLNKQCVLVGLEPENDINESEPAGEDDDLSFDVDAFDAAA